MPISIDKLRDINDQFDAGSTIASQLPIKLVNGFTVNKLNVKCLRCGTEVEQLWQRGKIIKGPETSYLVEGFGKCVPCNLLTGFRYHILPKGMDMELIPLTYKDPMDANGLVLPFPERK